MSNSKTADDLFFKIAVVVVATLALIAGSCTAVKRVTTDMGHETVLIDKPWFVGKGGVRADTLKPGAEFVWRSTQTVPLITTPYVIPTEISDFASADNILLDFESTVTVQVLDPSSVARTYGAEWWNNNLERPYIQAVRDQVKGNNMDKMMSDVGTAQRIDDSVTKALEAEVKRLGIEVRIVGVNLGRAKPNPKVLSQMDETAAQQQREKTLEQSRLAEVKRKEEQEAKADADNAYRNKMGLSPEQYLAKQLAEMQQIACIKATACYMVPAGTNVVLSR